MEKKKKSLQVTGVPVDLLKQAQLQAKKEDRPLSQIVRDLIRDWLKKESANG